MTEFLSSPGFLDTQAFAIRLALAGICVCAILLVAACVLRRRSEPLQYGVLFGGILGLLTVPALVGLGQYLSVLNVQPAEDEVLRVPMEMLPDLMNRPVMGMPLEEAEPPMLAADFGLNALWMIWGLGCVFGLAKLGRGFWKLNRTFIRQPWQAEFWTDDAKARLAQQLGMKRFPEVEVSPAVPMPMVIGIWRPSIVLPAMSPPSWEQTQFEAVLLHEAAHIARGDHWATLAQRLAVLLFWWCPLVYPLSRRLNELRENICDDYALQGACDQIAYAELLVESAERLVHLKPMPVALALLDSAHGGLEARITRLLAKEKRTMTKLSMKGKLLGAGFLVAAGLLMTTATAFSGGGAASAPQKKIQIKIIVDGKEIDINDAKILEHFESAQKKDVVIRTVVKEIPKDAAQKFLFTLPDQGNPIAVDARIEALVKQAEAIKPGSGAEIRKALQGSAKPADKVQTMIFTPGGKIAVGPDGKALFEIVGQTTAKPAVPGVKLWEATTGKKVIILQIDDGKVQQLNEADLKKLIEKGAQFNWRFDHAIPKEAPKAETKKETAKVQFEVVPFTVPLVAPATKAANPTELDALRRQLERITADLNDLRKQLNSGTKK